MVVMIAQQYECTWYWTVHLKMVKMVNFIFILPQFFKKWFTGGITGEPDLEKQESMVNMRYFKIMISKTVQLLRMTVSGLWPWELMHKAEGKDETAEEGRSRNWSAWVLDKLRGQWNDHESWRERWWRVNQVCVEGGMALTRNPGSPGTLTGRWG